MANNKVQLANGTVLIDLTDTTATASDVVTGSFFYDKAGIKREGTLAVDETYSITKALTNVSSSADDTKVIAGNSFFTELTPTQGYAITSITVTMGGVDVTEQVFKPGTGSKAITANGTYNASDDSLSGYDRVVVDVPTGSGEPSLQSKSVTVTPTAATQTQTVSPDSGYDGLSSVGVTVNPIPSQYIVPSGSQTISQNGTVDVTNLAQVVVSVSGSSGGTDISAVNLADGVSYVSGYLNTNGTMSSASSTNKEITTDYIDVSSLQGQTVWLYVTTGSSNSLWSALGYYDANKTWISRSAASTAALASWTINSSASYVRISTRTYGHLAFAFTKVADGRNWLYTALADGGANVISS